ncbi:DUF2628 domain-containing protein [Roseococcus sp. YIM B11640]|uniref:DUF2628 domain-containing protein n=1 Tax=Roseococcus sp. YIM B11640 TaxID=3133973 RepID=UPI003C7B285F
MRGFTVHLPQPGARRRIPVLVPEGFSFWAMLFGPLWLFRHGALLAGIGTLAAMVAAAALPGVAGDALPPALALLLGFHGHDLRRWTLARRGRPVAHVVLGRDEEAALFRLLTAEPGLVPLYAGARA